MKRALIIVDVQNDFCPGGALPVTRGDEVVGPINRIAGLFAVVAATRDWHPEGHVSFASAHAGRSAGDVVGVGGTDQMLWPDHCVRGTEGAQFHPALDTRPIHIIIHKGWRAELDSYSGFLETDRTTPTGLEGCLKGLGVTDVYLCGLATDYCVFFTAMDAVSAGFAAHVVSDAVRGIDLPAGNLERAIGEMRRAGVRFVESTSLA